MLSTQLFIFVTLDEDLHRNDIYLTKHNYNHPLEENDDDGGEYEDDDEE